MNKADLVTTIAKSIGQTKVHVQNSVAALLHTLTGALAKGERVTLVGFGTFERRNRQARLGVNPQNPKQKLRIEAAKVPVFRAGQELKNVVDGRAKLPTLKVEPTRHAPKKAAAKAKGKKKSSPAKKKKRKR
jgi:DNA-binding protein HU-beta